MGASLQINCDKLGFREGADPRWVPTPVQCCTQWGEAFEASS